MKSKKVIPAGVNDQNLTRITSILEDILYIPFYGTLLGLIRDGATILGDDDVDLVIRIEDRDRVISLLNAAGIDIQLEKWPNNIDRCFLQTKLQTATSTGYVDIYFVESFNNKLIDRWSFWGKPHVRPCYTKFPKEWLFDTIDLQFQGKNIRVPKDSENTLRYLYGKSWRKPAKKGISYLTMPVYGRPCQFYNRKKIFAKLYLKFIKIIY
jgi:hypothetical protein